MGYRAKPIISSRWSVWWSFRIKYFPRLSNCYLRTSTVHAKVTSNRDPVFSVLLSDRIRLRRRSIDNRNELRSLPAQRTRKSPFSSRLRACISMFIVVRLIWSSYMEISDFTYRFRISSTSRYVKFSDVSLLRLVRNLPFDFSILFVMMIPRFRL